MKHCKPQNMPRPPRVETKLSGASPLPRAHHSLARVPTRPSTLVLLGGYDGKAKCSDLSVLQYVSAAQVRWIQVAWIRLIDRGSIWKTCRARGAAFTVGSQCNTLCG